MNIDPGVIAVVMIFSIPLVAIIGGLGLEALKVMKKSYGKDQEPTSGRSPYFKFIYKNQSEKEPDLSAEETATIQELYRLALKMEKRIEALETLIMDRSHQTESAWSEKLNNDQWGNTQ